MPIAEGVGYDVGEVRRSFVNHTATTLLSPPLSLPSYVQAMDNGERVHTRMNLDFKEIMFNAADD